MRNSKSYCAYLKFSSFPIRYREAETESASLKPSSTSEHTISSPFPPGSDEIVRERPSANQYNMAHSHRGTRNSYPSQPGEDYLQRHLSPAPKKRRCTGVVHYRKARHAPGSPGVQGVTARDNSLVKPLSKPIMRVHSRWANRFMIPLHAGSQLGSNSENGKVKVAIRTHSQSPKKNHAIKDRFDRKRVVQWESETRTFNTARDRTGQCSDYEDFLFQFSREYRILVGGFNRHWEVFLERQIWAHFFLMFTDSAQWWWMTAMDDESRKNSGLACRRSLIDRIQQAPGRRSENFDQVFIGPKPQAKAIAEAIRSWRTST
ncbi:hypothetical protein K438DRAFT_2166236 [Mycena galopus ATCC 62051]|nr:hypothetical protein K438DRAFT_2166236 [Mycena galopus ATCC 62051]